MLSEKFIKKYMRLAKQVGEDNNPCYSRQIGVVLVKVYDDGASHVLSTGYNGPPRDTPHCDSREYLEKIVWPQLNCTEKDTALTLKDVLRIPEDAAGQEVDKHMKELFVDKYEGCGKCPRKIVGCKTGERTELCSCEHAERNAIYNATDDLHGVWCFAWCGVACWDCTKALINAGIKRCFFIADGSYARNGGSDYSFGSRWLFEKAGVSTFIEKPEYYLG